MTSSKQPNLRPIVIRWVLILGGFALFYLAFFPVAPRSMREAARRTEARAAASQLVVAIKAHLTEYGTAPAGHPAQVMSTLFGDNPRKIVFFEAAQIRINQQGEFTDPWRTPYRFDLTDPEKPRVWSYGKDCRDEGGAEGSDDIPSWR